MKRIGYPVGEVEDLINSFFRFVFKYSLNASSFFSESSYISLYVGCFPFSRGISWSYAWCYGSALCVMSFSNIAANSLYSSGYPDTFASVYPSGFIHTAFMNAICSFLDLHSQFKKVKVLSFQSISGL
jgi:hypothetical protein